LPPSCPRLGQVSSPLAIGEGYDLHKLGWNRFQQLCVTISREVLGQTVQSFLDSSDGGRDGAFSGTWKPNGREDLMGRFVIQSASSRTAEPVSAKPALGIGRINP
jgi:hypothetical protein